MPSNGFRSRINIQEKELSYLLTKRGVCGIFSGDISTDRGFIILGILIVTGVYS